MRFVDTNIFIRYLTDDLPEKADNCEKIFARAIENKEQLFTSELVIAEIIWVLESYYELQKEKIQEMVEKILNTRNLTCINKNQILNALAIYAGKNIDYTDAYNAVILREKGIKEIYSYDAHFDRIPWLKRIEP